MITATIVVRLDHPEDDFSRWWRLDQVALSGLDTVPDGARVVVVVGGRRWAAPEAVRALHEHLDRLVLDVHAKAGWIAETWMRAIRERRELVAEEPDRPEFVVPGPKPRPAYHDQWAHLAGQTCQCRDCRDGEGR